MKLYSIFTSTLILILYISIPAIAFGFTITALLSALMMATDMIGLEKAEHT